MLQGYTLIAKEAQKDGYLCIKNMENPVLSLKVRDLNFTPTRYLSETEKESLVIELKNKTKLCALKIHWKLEKEGLNIHARTIRKIIKKKGLVRKYRTRKIQYKYLKPSLLPGVMIEIDIKYTQERLNNWRYLKIYDDMPNFSAIRFLKEVLK